MHLTNIQCCYLAAASLREAKEFTEAMEMLHESCSEPLENSKVLLNNTSQLESNFGVSVIEDLSMYSGNTVSNLIYVVFEIDKYLKIIFNLFSWQVQCILNMEESMNQWIIGI